MKTITRFWAAAAVFAGLFTACSDLDDIKNKVDELDGRLTALETITTNLNKNIEAMQALYSGATVNSATEKDGVWTVVLSNGETLTLNQGSIGVANAPVMSVDKDGYWMVDYDGAEGNAPSYILTGENKVQATGADGKTPLFAVDAEKYWTVSYDAGTTYERVLGADGQPVKAIQDGQAQDSYFSDVKLDGGQLKVTLKTGEELVVPVVPDFLCAIEATGLQQFNAGETKPYNVTIKGVSSTMITAPAGWTATLSEPVDNKAVLTVTAPALTKAVIADSKSDVCILAFSEKGFATIAKVNVGLSDEPEGDGPAVDDDPVVEEITDLYQAYVDGKEIEIAGVKYSKAVNGEATLLTATEAETDIRAKLNTPKQGIFFLDATNDGSFITSAIVDIKGDMILIGRHTTSKVVFKPNNHFKFVNGSITLKNLTVNMENLKNESGKNNGTVILNDGTEDLKHMHIDGCTFYNMIRPIYNASSTNGCKCGVKSIIVTNSTIDISGTANVQIINLYNTSVLAKFEEIKFDNNIVCNDENGACQVQNWGNSTAQTETDYKTVVSFCNNTFYNAPGANPHIKLQEVASLVMKNNIFWASAENNNGNYLVALYGQNSADGIEISDNIAFGLAEGKNWDIAHSNSKYKPVPNRLTKLAESPLATVDFTTYTFTPTAEYAGYGAQR